MINAKQFEDETAVYLLTNDAWELNGTLTGYASYVQVSETADLIDSKLYRASFAWDPPGGGINYGLVELFQYDGTGWTLKTSLTGSKDYEQFGVSMAVNGDEIAITSQETVVETRDGIVTVCKMQHYDVLPFPRSD